jgi:hypothetical protein
MTWATIGEVTHVRSRQQFGPTGHFSDISVSNINHHSNTMTYKPVHALGVIRGSNIN